MNLRIELSPHETAFPHRTQANQSPKSPLLAANRTVKIAVNK
jgi:hypothetical protein